MQNEMRDYRVEEQQRFLNQLAAKHDFVCFRPDYHGKERDGFTVLLYLKEDEAHNRMVDNQPTRYSYSEARDAEKYHKISIPENCVYRPAFYCFSNLDRNGQIDSGFAQFGKLDLRDPQWKSRLTGDILLEFYRRLQANYIKVCGGYAGIREADQTYNDYNRELIKAFCLRHGKAFMGKINIYDEKKLEAVKLGESPLTPVTIDQLVHNFECDFVIAEEDAEMCKRIRVWNCGDYTAKMEVGKIIDRIKDIGGEPLVWY